MTCDLPELFAVIDRDAGDVLARGMARDVAEGFAAGWARIHNRQVEIVPERLVWQPAAALLA